MAYKNPEDRKAYLKKWYQRLPQTKKKILQQKAKLWYKNLSPEQRRDKQLKRRLRWFYHITPGEYLFILASQGGGCKICGARKGDRWETLSVDHDHKTGFIRGLLCDSCNHALGELRDDPVLVERALAYIKRGQGGGAHVLPEA